MKIRAFSATVIGAAALVFLLVLLVTLAPPARTEEDNEGSKIRWDIFSFNLSGTIIAPGGVANALADDNSKITLTGSGTFVTTNDSSERRVTGGGNWQTFDPQGNSTGTGTYKVRRLDGFDPAAGSLVGSGITDTIGDLANAQTGLAVFAIEYSDGSRGTLVLSCSFGPGTGSPSSVFEGITATKGFVGYWNRENGLPITTADQTIFHVVPQTD